MGINKDEARERIPARRSKKQTLAEAVDRRMPPPAPRPFGAAAPRESYGDFHEFMGSGDFRSVVFKPDGQGGGTFTVKGLLEMWTPPVSVYLHGAVDSVEMLPSVLDHLVRKGAWRIDQYAKPSNRDR